MIKKIIFKLLIDKTTNVGLQFFRYLFVGGSAFMADFCMLFIFKEWFRVNLYIAVAIAFIFGLTVNYIISKLIVFNKENSIKEFIVFTAIGIIGLIFTELLMHFFTTMLSIQYLISKVIVSGIVLIWNFTAKKIILYRES